MDIKETIIYLALLALVAVGITLAYTRDGQAHDFWINQDKYKSPSAAGVLYGTHCCGDKDCYEAKEGIDYVADGDNWRFIAGPVQRKAMEDHSYDIEGDTWPRALDQTYQSEDHNSWLCVANIGIRCFFRDSGGF